MRSHLREKKQLLGGVLCTACAVVWGSGFVVMKEGLNLLPPSLLLATRFLGAFAVLCPVFAGRLRRMTAATLRHGLLVGVVLAAAYLAQTYGLDATTPGKNAFLTAIYCVLVPFVAWLLTGRRPSGRNLGAGLLCALGIGLISLQGSFRIGAGDALSLLCGLLFAFQVALLGLFNSEDDPILMTILQMGTAGGICLAVGLATEPLPSSFPAGGVPLLLYLVLAATVLTNVMQNIGQGLISSSVAALLLSLESVFGTLFSVLFYGERLSARVLAGFAAVLAAVLVSQLPSRGAAKE